MYQRLLVALIIATATTAPAFAGNGNESKSNSQPVSYCVYDIGRLSSLPAGETFVTINAINRRNQIVGSISIAGGDRTHAFIWDREDGMRDLGVLPGHTNANANDINDKGTVVGDIFDPETGDALAFIWTESNGMQALDVSLGGPEGAALGINRSGEIVGASEISTSSELVHAFLREVDGDVLDLGALPGGDGSIAFAVNNSGQVVGTSVNTEGFIWDEDDGIRRLIESNTPALAPSDINDRGVVVGEALGADPTRAFRWTESEGLQDLGSLGGLATDATTATEINRRGDIVGASQIAGGASHAFIWTQRSGMRDLNELLDPSSALASQVVLVNAKAINNFGWIAVEGHIPGAEDPQRGFLLEPRHHPGSPPCQ